VADIAAAFPSRILPPLDPAPVPPDRQGPLGTAGRAGRPAAKDFLQDNRSRPEGPRTDDAGGGKAKQTARGTARRPLPGLGTPGPGPAPGPAANQRLVQLFSPGLDGEASEAPPAADQKTGIAAYRAAQSVIPPQPPATDDAGLLVVEDHPAIDLTI